MKQLFTPLLLLLLTLTACNSNNKKEFEHAGGALHIALDNPPSSFFASEVTDMYTQSIMSQVYEGLVSFNPQDLQLSPCLAKKWTSSNDNLIFTFELRNDVYFHENDLFSNEEERKLTPEDVVASFERACKKTKEGQESSAYLSIFSNQLLGATEFHQGKSKSIKGIQIKNNSIVLQLVNPDPAYVEKLAQVNAAILSKKVLEANKEALLIGTGPFIYPSDVKESQKEIVLLKNSDYYLVDDKGNAMPYLDSIVFHIEAKKLEQLELFENGTLDIIASLPSSRISDMLEGHIKDFNSKPPKLILYNNALLQSHYYFFNMTDIRFKDVKVRQAFNYAVNREKITHEVLNEQFYENGIYGLVPPIGSLFKGYDFKGIKTEGYSFDPEKAKKLLAEAGFPGGKGFGSVNLRLNIGDINSAVATEVSEQIYQVLGINVNIDASSFESKDEDADFAKGDIFRTSWTADFPSPESFLLNFYGKLVPNSLDKASQINQSRYINPVFDDYFEKGRKANNLQEQYKYFAQAEIEMLKNPPMIMIWYANDYQLIRSNIRDLKINPMRILDFRKVYFKEWTKEEYLKSVK